MSTLTLQQMSNKLQEKLVEDKCAIFFINILHPMHLFAETKKNINSSDYCRGQLLLPFFEIAEWCAELLVQDKVLCRLENELIVLNNKNVHFYK